MNIDVMDLKLKKLTFSDKYSAARLNRAKQIFHKELVDIKEIKQISDARYIIKSNVKGYYGDYDIVLIINNEQVTACSCTCEDNKKGYICKHILATVLEVVNPHNASTDEGKKLFRKRKEEEKKQYLENLRKEREAQKQRELYNYKYTTSLELLNNLERTNKTEEKANLNLPKLYNETISKRNLLQTSKNINIKIEDFVELSEENNALRVSFKIGNTRKYILNDLDVFFKAYVNQEEIYYGKQLSFTPNRDIIDEESKSIFDFIIKYAKMINYSRFNNYYDIEQSFKRYIYLKVDDIDEYFNLHKNTGITIGTYNGPDKYNFTDETLDIYCILKKGKVETQVPYMYRTDEDDYITSDELFLTLNIEDYDYVLSSKKIYIFTNNKIYTMDRKTKIVDLLKLFEYTSKILIPEDKLEEFKNVLFPTLKIKNETFLKLDNAKVISLVATKMFLDTDENGNILLTTKFCYNNYEHNILEPDYTQYIENNNIVRDIPNEEKTLKRIFNDGFRYIPNQKSFIMSNVDDMYDFLYSKIEGYMNDYEVLVTDKFKNKQIKKTKISNIGIKIDNGLLELDLSKININIKEIKDVLKDYDIKKKYHKLKNGDILDLTKNEDLDLLDELSDTLDIDYNKMDTGIITLPVSRSFYLEKLANTSKDINISRNEEFLNVINTVENIEKTDTAKIPNEFENILRDYQKVGFRWLTSLAKLKLGGILADDMGLGKTLQIIAILKAYKDSGEKLPSIVVCPSTLVLNWKSEVEKWCNTLKVLTITGKADERIQKINLYNNYDLIIISYDLLKRDIDQFNDKYFKYIIADEAQYIKNASTQNATALKSLKGEIKYALTGTPMENSVAELWSIFDYIMPGYLYNYNKFKKKFEEPILKQENTEMLIRLKKLISPFILRRVKNEVLAELPDKSITIMKNEMENEQQKIYMSYLLQTKKEVSQELNSNGFEKSKFKILMLLTRLRQICCHPSLFIENYNGGSGKLNQCMDLINDAVSANHKILLFSSYTSMFEIIEKELEKRNIQFYKLIGSTPVNDRIKMVEEFNKNDNIKIFLISLKAGGTGLNLTSADIVIHYDPWWNVSSENQATDRAYRIGQKNNVQVYKLITTNSIEEKINQMQERKERLSKDILSTKETFINKMSKEEILELFA